jgi:hypothetical protein
MFRRPALPVWLLITALAFPGYAQFRDDQRETGDAAAAERYLAWAETAVEENRWAQAEEALERAADYSAVSSDLSYLLALVRAHQNRPRGAVLEAVRRALETDRWNRYTPDAARLLEAETFIAIRAFPDALQSLAPVRESADEAVLRLLALKGLGDIPEFRGVMARSLEQYPRDPRPIRILFEYAAGRPPDETGRELIALALRRLPIVLEACPALAYLAVPFIRDTEEARRLVAAYRAVHTPLPASIPAALKLGLIDETRAVDELFQSGPAGPPLPGEEEPRINKALLLSVLSLLRNQAGREYFTRNLSSFSGVIIEDYDMDGYIESAARYQKGTLLGYSYDADQDGLAELEISFTEGVPAKAEAAVLPDRPSPVPGAALPASPLPAYPVQAADRSLAFLTWEQYPAVLEATLEGVRYILRPLELFFAPVRLTALAGAGPSAFLYPEREPAVSRISKRSLVSFSLIVERPGRNFEGALERVELDHGIPRRASEIVDGRIAGITEFLLGQPRIQRIDLDLDGRMETVRRFRGSPSPPGDPLEYQEILESSESDWDGDGIFEYEERYLPGSVIRSWDMDKDGIKEYIETDTGD